MPCYRLWIDDHAKLSSVEASLPFTDDQTTFNAPTLLTKLTVQNAVSCIIRLCVAGMLCWEFEARMLCEYMHLLAVVLEFETTSLRLDPRREFDELS